MIMKIIFIYQVIFPLTFGNKNVSARTRLKGTEVEAIITRHKSADKINPGVLSNFSLSKHKACLMRSSLKLTD
jgi:hypothetical protein